MNDFNSYVIIFVAVTQTEVRHFCLFFFSHQTLNINQLYSKWKLLLHMRSNVKNVRRLFDFFFWIFIVNKDSDVIVLKQMSNIVNRIVHRSCMRHEIRKLAKCSGFYRIVIILFVFFFSFLNWLRLCWNVLSAYLIFNRPTAEY